MLRNEFATFFFGKGYADGERAHGFGDAANIGCQALTHGGKLAFAYGQQFKLLGGLYPSGGCGGVLDSGAGLGTALALLFFHHRGLSGFAQQRKEETFALGSVGEEMIDVKIASGGIAADFPFGGYGEFYGFGTEFATDAVDIVFVFGAIVGAGTVNEVAALAQGGQMSLMICHWRSAQSATA